MNLVGRAGAIATHGPSALALALHRARPLLRGTYFALCLLYDMGPGGEQLGFDAASCSGGTDPRVDLLGFWFAFCVIVDPTVGPPPGGDPGELVIDPGFTFPIVDVTPCGGVDPSVQWMGNEAVVCLEPSVEAPRPGATFVDCEPGVGVTLIVAGQTVGTCYDP